MNRINKPDFYKNMIVSGANNLYNFYPQIDKLNVFPVPDGDTGTNLNLTISNAIVELKNLPDEFSFNELSEMFSYGLIMSARGNSGVIFSQIFKGIANTLSKSVKYIDLNILKNMFDNAKKIAYKAVIKPVEGTILTVVKDISNFLSNITDEQDTDIILLFKKIVKEGNESVKRTTDLLPILKEVGVVDSGAFGLMKFIEGMSYYLEHEKILKKNKKNANVVDDNKNFSQITDNKDFGYCVETIVSIGESNNINIHNIQNVLESQENNSSIILVTDKNILKVHIHSLNPGNILIYLQQFGQFLKVKIENMSEQVHNNMLNITTAKKTYPDKIKLLMVVTTKKLQQYFKSELNIENVIVSGEDKNLSTQEFINAIKDVDAKTVIVLPNDSNSILSSQNAVKLLDTKQIVHILPTNNIQEGLLVAISFNPYENIRKNLSNLKNSISKSISISIYKCSKDVKNGSFYINKNDYVAISGKKVIVSNASLLTVVIKTLAQKISKYSEAVTIIQGINTSQTVANELKKHIDENYDVEYEFVDGEQEKFEYLILIE